MGFSNLGDRIGKFFFTLGLICAICIGLFRMCVAGVETLKEKVTTSQEASASEDTETSD